MSVSDLKLKVHHPSLYGDACHKKFLNSIFSHPVFQVVLFVIRLVFTCLLLFFGECLLTMEIICIFRDCQPWNFSQLLSRKVQSMRHYQIEMMNYMMVNQANFRVLAFSQVGLAHCLKIGMPMFQEVDDLSIPLHTKFYRYYSLQNSYEFVLRILQFIQMPTCTYKQFLSWLMHRFFFPVALLSVRTYIVKWSTKLSS